MLLVGPHSVKVDPKVFDVIYTFDYSSINVTTGIAFLLLFCQRCITVFVLCLDC